MTTEELEALGELPHSKWPAGAVARVWRAAMDAREVSAALLRRAEEAEARVVELEAFRKAATLQVAADQAATEKIRQEERERAAAFLRTNYGSLGGLYGQRLCEALGASEEPAP